MMDPKQQALAIIQLTDTLSKYSGFIGKEVSITEVGALANAIVDISASAENICANITPKLRGNLSDTELAQLLNDLGEELRHILYHVKDASYYSYLISPE